MSAREDLLNEYGQADTAPLGTLADLRQKLDAYRADVLAEAEVEITLAVERNQREHPDEAAMVARRLGMRAAERIVRGMREETEEESSPVGAEATPDFFQPGHTYAQSEFPQYDWRFRCDTVTAHPEDGERTALGWRFWRGNWEAYAYGEDDWEVHLHVGLTDVTGTEAAR